MINPYFYRKVSDAESFALLIIRNPIFAFFKGSKMNKWFDFDLLNVGLLISFLIKRNLEIFFKGVLLLAFNDFCFH